MANDPNGAAGKLDASSAQPSSGQPHFSAVLKMLFAGTLPSATGSAVAGGANTIPEPAEAVPLPKVPSTNRPNGKTKTSAASALNSEAAVAANLLPALPHDTQTTSAVSSATTGKAAPTTPAVALPQFSGTGSDTVRLESKTTIPAAEMLDGPPKATIPVAEMFAGSPAETPSKLQSIDGAAPNVVRTLTPSEPKERLDGVSAPAPATQGAAKLGVPLAPSAPTAALRVERDPTVPLAVASISPQAEPAAVGPEREPAATKVSVTSADASANVGQAAPTEQTAAPALVKPAPVLPVADQIHEQVSSHLDQLRQTGRVEMQLELHPPELGRVQLHLTLEDGHLNVRMTVQDENAKRQESQN